jgi:hypothetical protein
LNRPLISTIAVVSLLVGHPVRAPLAARVNRPPDLNILAAPDILGGHEMAQNPSSAFFPVILGVPGIDQMCHGERR